VVLAGAPAVVTPRLGSQAADVFEILEVHDHDLLISPVNGTYPEPAPPSGTVWGGITGTLSNQTDLGTALGTKVTANAPITGATKTKVTYGANGLVTAGADATTADIADSADKRYCTDAQKTVIGNTSGTNTGDQDLSGMESKSPSHYLVPVGTTIQTVLAAAAAAGHGVASPAWVVVQEARSENVSLTVGGIYLKGRDSSGVHCPIVITGKVTVNGAAGAIGSNRFSLEGLEVIGPSGDSAISFEGTNPQRLFLKDVWLTAQGAGYCMSASNAGSGSIIQVDDFKLSHNGTGWCLHCVAGATSIASVETSGAVGLGHVETGATLSVNYGELDANDVSAFDVEAGATLTLAGCVLTNAAANSNGIRLLGVAAVAYVVDTAFNVPAGTGRAVEGGAGTFFTYQRLIFAPGGSTKVNPAITSTALGTTPSFS
jgi:hypothetical protein